MKKDTSIILPSVKAHTNLTSIVSKSSDLNAFKASSIVKCRKMPKIKGNFETLICKANWNSSIKSINQPKRDRSRVWLPVPVSTINGDFINR